MIMADSDQCKISVNISVASASTPKRKLSGASDESTRTPKRMRRDLRFHHVSPTVLQAKMVRDKYRRHSPLSSTARNLLLSRCLAVPDEGVRISLFAY